MPLGGRRRLAHSPSSRLYLSATPRSRLTCVVSLKEVQKVYAIHTEGIPLLLSPELPETFSPTKRAARTALVAWGRSATAPRLSDAHRSERAKIYL
jgi:hypothetical protein